MPTSHLLQSTDIRPCCLEGSTEGPGMLEMSMMSTSLISIQWYEESALVAINVYTVYKLNIPRERSVLE